MARVHTRRKTGLLLAGPLAAGLLPAGAGASNQDDTVAVKDNAGTVQGGQGNQDVTVVVAPTFN
ncbi:MULTISPECIES: hypothetical protein [unclassified Kitasatospora]